MTKIHFSERTYLFQFFVHKPVLCTNTRLVAHNEWIKMHSKVHKFLRPCHTKTVGQELQNPVERLIVRNVACQRLEKVPDFDSFAGVYVLLNGRPWTGDPLDSRSNGTAPIKGVFNVSNTHLCRTVNVKSLVALFIRNCQD